MLRTALVFAALLALTAPAAAQAPQIFVAPAGYTAPSSAAYEAPAPAYPRGRGGRIVIGTRHELQNDRGLWGAGLGLFLGGWVLDIVGTAIANAISTERSEAAEQDAQAWSLLPFAGPLIQLGVGAPHPAIPITSGLMQIGGLVLFVMGMTSQHDEMVPTYALGDPHDPTTPRLAFDVAPRGDGAFATVTLSM